MLVTVQYSMSQEHDECLDEIIYAFFTFFDCMYSICIVQHPSYSGNLFIPKSKANLKRKKMHMYSDKLSDSESHSSEEEEFSSSLKKPK